MTHECNEKGTLRSIEKKVDTLITGVHKIDVRLSVAEYKLSTKAALFGIIGGAIPAVVVIIVRFIL